MTIPKKPKKIEHLDWCHITLSKTMAIKNPECDCLVEEYNQAIAQFEKREKWLIETLEKIRFKDYDIKALIMFCKQHIFLPENDNFQILDALLNGATDKFLSHLQDKEVAK